jgi:hypothetical protein
MRILVAADVIERFETFATVAGAPVNVDRPRGRRGCEGRCPNQSTVLLRQPAEL